MRRQRTHLLTCALIAAAMAVGSPAAAQSALNGTWTLNAQASSNIRAAVDSAVQRMNFVTRPIARGRLMRTNAAYSRVVIDYGTERVSITFDQRAAIVTPANGTPVQWTREDGEKFNVSTEWENGRLEQTFQAEDGQRTNVYTLSSDGRTLTMNVTVTSPRLPRPLTYRLVFNRAS